MKLFASALLVSLVSLVTAAPVVEKRWPSGNIITPVRGYIYHQSATHPPPDFIPKIQGLIDWQSSTSEVHIFSLPQNWIGKKVQVRFWSNNVFSPSDKTFIDVFSSSRLPPDDLIGSNNRDKHLARFLVPEQGDAIPNSDGPTGWQSYQLPAGVGAVAFEAVGVGSYPIPTKISYELAESGIYLKLIG